MLSFILECNCTVLVTMPTELTPAEILGGDTVCPKCTTTVKSRVITASTVGRGSYTFNTTTPVPAS